MVIRFEAAKAGVFASIDLYLEFQRRLRVAFRRELEHKVHLVSGLRAIALPEPR